MAKRKSAQTDSVEVEETSYSAPSQPIWERNPNLLLYIVGGIVVALAGWWGYKELIVKPKQQEALSAMWQAELQFTRDSFDLALNNPGGGFDGFLTIADKFSGTKAGNMARYYAGVCYLQMGNFDNAIQQLEDFSPEGNLFPAMKAGILGDCYSEKQDFGKALDLYEEAADATDIDLIAVYYLKKLGMLSEKQGKAEQAAKAFERIRRDYPNQQSPEWREIEKYLYRANGGGN